MRTIFIGVVAMFCAAFQQVHAQDEIFCGTHDTVTTRPFEKVQQMINTTMNLALVFVDFQDGRKPDGTLATVDADTIYFTGDSIDAVGGMGYVQFINPPNPPVWRKKIRKYVYEDYWDWMFSDSTYVGTRHPDNQSHGIEVFGSVKDYYKEVSYNNLTITPAQTWTFPPNNYRQGIINAIDTANSRRFVRWIVLPHPKAYYNQDLTGTLLAGDIENVLRARHSLPPNHPDYVDFSIDSYAGQRVMIITAGGGYAGYVGIDIGGIYHWIQTAEKARPNTQPEVATLQGIKVPLHEIGHSIGFSHVQAGSYDPMNQGVWGVYSHSPTHFNPWHKLMAGWIPFSNVVRINSEISATIYPVETIPSFAVVTIYGDAGRGNAWGHSEYFLVEYRKRQKFNRFIGGQFATGFDGGMLVWQYSSSGNFSILIPTGGNAQIIPKVADDLNTFYANTGDPAHFYGHNGMSLTPITWPNTNARIDSVSGISLTNFQKTPSSASFSVQYGRGVPTQYDDYLFGVVTGQHSGSIYVDWINGVSSFTITQGSTLGVFPSDVTVANIVAQGSSQSPIVFRGIGYQGNHAPWLALRVGQGNYNTRISYCQFLKNGGLVVEFDPWDPSLGGPVIQQNTFVATSGPELVFSYMGDDPNTLPLLNGYDQNNWANMIILGSWRCTSEFTILAGRALSWGNRNPHLPETLDFGSTGGLSIYGTFNLPRIPYLKNARISFLDEGSINGVLKFLGSSTLISHKSAGLLELNTSLSIEPNSSLAFEGDPIYFNSSFAGLVGKENSHLSSVPSFNFNQGATFVLEPGVTLSVREGSALSVFGPLTLIGTSQQPITFEKHPSASNWLGIHIESGLAVSELRHCVITDAITGVSVNSSRFKLKESAISNCSVGIDISGYHPKLYYQIDTNTVQNCWTAGIVISNAENVTLHDNTISGCTTGLVTTQGTSRLYRNVIENSAEEGVFAGEYSNPRFGDVLLADPGNNVIRSSGIAALHAVNSTPFLGIGCERVYGGWNSVYGDALLVNAEKGAYVSANWNWWGMDPPKAEQFTTDEGSWIDYDCWLPYDPNEGMRPSGSPTLTSSKGGDDPPPIQSITPERAKLLQALALRGQGDYRRALGVYANLIRLSPNASETRVALSELRNTFHDFILSSNDTTLHGALEDSLRALRSSHPNALLRRLAKALAAIEITNRRDFAGAIAEYNQLLQSATTHIERAMCLFTLFNVNSQGIRDRSEAQRYLTQLQTLYPTDIRTRIASVRFASMIDAQSGNGMQKPSIARGPESLTSLPTEFALVQNYPNPFNPSTTIKYNLPIDAHVTLKLYDVLGREVLTLVDEQAKGGFHSATLDASSLSSGVYFYRMQAGAFAQTKKLLLLR